MTIAASIYGGAAMVNGGGVGTTVGAGVREAVTLTFLV